MHNNNNQVHERPINLHLLYNMSFLSTIVWYNKPNRSKIIQVIHLLLVCCLQKLFSCNPGISIFWNSIYLWINSESNSNLYIWYIHFSCTKKPFHCMLSDILSQWSVDQRKKGLYGSYFPGNNYVITQQTNCAFHTASCLLNTCKHAYQSFISIFWLPLL